MMGRRHSIRDFAGIPARADAHFATDDGSQAPVAATAPEAASVASSDVIPAPAYRYFYVAGEPAKLPEIAEQRFEALTDYFDSANEKLTRMSEELREASNNAHKAEALFKYRAEANANTYSPASSGYIAEQARVEKLKATGQRLREKHAKHTEATDAGRRTFGLVSAYVKAHGSALAPAKVKPSTLSIDAMRKRIATLVADLHTTRSAPFPSGDIKAKFRAEIEALAAAGKPDVLGGIDHLEGVRWPRKRLDLLVAGAPNPGAMVTGIDALALTAWLHKDALVAAIEAEVDKHADDGSALSATERAKREREIRAQILSLELQEAAAMFEAGRWDFRSDVDPRAVLGVDGPAPEAY